MILQFPDRGKTAHRVTEAFWNKDWNLLVPAVERVDGSIRRDGFDAFSLAGALEREERNLRRSRQELSRRRKAFPLVRSPRP
jgi:hypothetical protein